MMWLYYGRKRPDFADRPAQGQESVWDYPRPPGVMPDTRRIRVVVHGNIIADTVSSVRILETASPPTFYIPPCDVNLQLLRTVAGTSNCEWKGAAVYWSLTTEDEGNEAVGWSYPKPKDAFQRITGYFSFYPGRIDCYVDEERVRPQPGLFYGGWMTNDISGPVKGAQGTGHW